MRSSDIPPTLGLLLILSVQLMDALPLQNTALTAQDIDVLKLLLQRLEETVPASSQTLFQDTEEEAGDGETLIHSPSETDVRQYLSARDMKTVRQDSKRYSGCFGSRLDRIGSMSSLGCKTAGRTGPKMK